MKASAGGGGVIDGLTARERTLACLVASGLSNHAVAEALGLSRKTVEWHLARLYQKTGVTNREQLSRLLGRNEPTPPKLRD